MPLCGLADDEKGLHKTKALSEALHIVKVAENSGLSCTDRR